MKPKTRMDHTPEQLKENILFCPCCFASNDDSSWGGDLTEAYCMNCCHGQGLSMPRWAVVSIREQASWVGKRYYPHEEDYQAQEELQDLRAIPKTYPGRTAKLWGAAPRFWSVEQKKPDGSIISIMVSPDKAKTKQAALKEAQTRLPYVPAKKLKGKR